MGSNGWREPQTAQDVFGSINKRLSAQERRPSPAAVGDSLGPGMSARAVQILDWNTEEATFNGFYWSIPGALHSPDPEIPWTGQVIAKDDGSGMQQVWNVDEATGTAYWVRTYVPNDLGDGNVIFTDWKKFATQSGLIGVPELDQPILDDIDTALSQSQAAIEASLAIQANRVFRQPEPPVSDEDYTLKVNDAWFDTDDGNSIHLWDGTAWVGADHALLADLDARTLQAQADATAALEDASDALDAAVSTSRIFRQGTAPVSDASYTLRVNDSWFNTANGNEVKTWDGDSWEALTLGTATIPTLSGTTIETETTANRGIKMNSTGLIGYDSVPGSPTLGQAKFLLTTAGALTLVGPITSGGEVNGAIVTGGTIQTESTAARGLKMTSTGLVAYDGGGSPTFSVTASSGAVAMKGTLQSGSDIAGATLTGVLQTSPAASTGVKISNSGIYVYNTSNQLVMSALNSGSGYFSGSLASGISIDSPILTGGTVQTESTGSRGIKMTSTGLIAYDSVAGSPTLGQAMFTLLSSTGQVSMKGSLTSGSTVSGATITGSSLTTSTGAGKVEIKQSGSSGLINFYDSFGSIVGAITGGTGYIALTGAVGGASMTLTASSLSVGNGQLSATGGLAVTSGADVAGGLTVSSGWLNVSNGGITLTGGGLVTNGYNANLQGGNLLGCNQMSGTGGGVVTATGGLTVTGGRTKVSNYETVTTVPNCRIDINNAGEIKYTTHANSSRRYKDNFREVPFSASTFLSLTPWEYTFTKGESVGYDNLGFIVEDAEELGLEPFIGRDPEGRPDEFDYAKWTIALQVICREQQKAIDELLAWKKSMQGVGE